MKNFFTKKTIPSTGGTGLKHPNAIGRELRGPTLWFKASVVPENNRGERWLEQGVVVAKVLVADDASSDTTYGSTYKYVPYNSYASYGTGSDTAVGVLDRLINLNYESDQLVSPVVHSQLIEKGAYIYGSAKGSIPQAVKTQLSHILWV